MKSSNFLSFFQASRKVTSNIYCKSKYYADIAHEEKNKCKKSKTNPTRQPQELGVQSAVRKPWLIVTIPESW